MLAYVREWVPEPRKAPLGGNTVGTDRGFLARDMPSSRPTCTTASSTSPRSRSCPGAGTRGPTSTPRRRAAATARSPTSARPSPSCATTARPSSCRSPARTPTPPRPSPPATWSTPTPPDAEPPYDAPATPGRSAGGHEHRSGTGTMGAAAGGRHVRSRRMVGVAQLVERRVVVADVAGSSPVTHPRSLQVRRFVGRCPLARGHRPACVPDPSAGVTQVTGGVTAVTCRPRTVRRVQAARQPGAKHVA